jgi:hypothetical protein
VRKDMGAEYAGLPLAKAHCDSRVLHAPGVCEFCDAYPEAQVYRIEHRICFTGWSGIDMVTGFDLDDRDALGWLPCPADKARPPGSPSDHRRWGGNKPTSAVGDPSWPLETFASQVLYGDRGGRESWPRIELLRRRAVAPLHRVAYWLRGWERTDLGYTFGIHNRPRCGATGQRLAALLMRIR